ncbi:hypothetical protein P7K49_040045 [Saguinus oedipus]|uniref:Uncharacterized protein n=1 Tax=Saguinus oedipus TaxID=9490 RepID=A0ABQ9TBU8_SAGOE|nr:hypothetical protein P7K49_040045 [Saguinus oedipus]
MNKGLGISPAWRSCMSRSYLWGWKPPMATVPVPVIDRLCPNLHPSPCSSSPTGNVTSSSRVQPPAEDPTHLLELLDCEVSQVRFRGLATCDRRTSAALTLLSLASHSHTMALTRDSEWLLEVQKGIAVLPPGR